MYHPARIAAAEEALTRELAPLLPQGLVRYQAKDSIAMADYLESLRDPDTGQLTRPLTHEEEAFILNEQLLWKIDWAYGAERYIRVNKEAQGLAPIYPLWESQHLILGEIARIEQQHWEEGHPDGILVNILKARQLGACLDPATQVLTTDLRWVPLDTVVVGDELVSVEEFPRGGRGCGRRMQAAIVEARADLHADTYELVFDTGVRVIATGDHRWLTRNRGGVDTKWRPVRKMIVGDVVRYLTRPWATPTLDDAWFGGLLDGEGSLSARQASGAEVNVSQVAGAVFDRAHAYLRDRGYHVRVEHDAGARPSKFGSRAVDKLCVSRMDELYRLLGQTRPTRFLHRRWWDGKELPGKRNGFGWARVVEIRPAGRRRVIDLQTSTKTFVAEGLVSHNSTLSQSLIAHRVLTHTYVKALIASDTPDNSGSDGLFGMLELLVAHLPWWLKPEEKNHVKNKHIVFANASIVRTESGKSMKGGLTEEGGQKGQMGRSKTYSAAHLSELSTWEHPEQIDDSLLPAIPRTPRTLVVFESTAKGRANWWHRHWQTAARRRGRFVDIFIPWYAERSKYWLPAPLEWTPHETTLAFAQRAEREGPKWMGRTVHLSREQLFWYESTKADFEEKGALYKFLEEYPADPEEAFQYSGRSVFPIHVRERIRGQARGMIAALEIKSRAELSKLLQQDR